MFKTDIVPRVSETDGAGHVNNTVVPIWFEAGRRDIFRIFTPDLVFKDWRIALVNMNVDYLAQIYLDKTAQVCTWVERIGIKSFSLYEELWQNKQLCSKGTVTYVYFDYKTNKSVPIPGSIKTSLLHHALEQTT